MASYRTIIRTPVDLPSAFAYVSRFDRAAEWDPGVEEGEMLTAEPVGLGSRFRLVAGFLGRDLPLEYEIVDFDAPNRVVLRAEAPTFRSTDTITFTPDGSGTIVGYDADLHPLGLARLADPLLAVVFRRIGDRAAAGLREHLRAVPATSPS